MKIRVNILSLFILLFFMSISVIAGPKYYVTFYNQTNETVFINPDDSTDWFPNDFDQTWFIPPQSTIRLYTESKPLKDGSVGVDLFTEKGKFAYIAIWINNHSESDAKYNVSRSSRHNKEWIGSSNPKVTTRMSSTIEGSTGGVVDAKVFIPRDAL